MTNKYLEKLAMMQEKVDDAFKDYHATKYEIDEPIRDMNDKIDNLAYSFDVDEDNPFVDYIKELKTERLRKSLEAEHDKNHDGTVKTLLWIGGIDAQPNTQQSKMIMNRLGEIRPERNGYQATRTAGSTIGAIAGGVGGFALGAMKTGNPGIAFASSLAGSVVGGFGTHMGLGAMLGHKIEARNTEIYNTREHQLQRAYDKIREVLSPTISA